MSSVLKCDKCGNYVGWGDGGEYKVKTKVKRWWSSWGESGWEKLDLCLVCQEIFREFAKEKHDKTK